MAQLQRIAKILKFCMSKFSKYTFQKVYKKGVDLASLRLCLAGLCLYLDGLNFL